MSIKTSKSRHNIKHNIRAEHQLDTHVAVVCDSLWSGYRLFILMLCAVIVLSS